MPTFKQVVLVAALAFTLGNSHVRGQEGKDVDEELLKENGLGTTARDLLTLLEKWSGNDAELLAADKFVRDLDSNSFEDRNAASNALIRLGAPVARTLVEMIPTSSVEARRRAQACLNQIRSTWKPAHRTAAVRRLVKLKPIGTAEALIRFIPWAGDNDLIEMIFFEVYDLAKADAKNLTALDPALMDRLPERRALAGCVLGRLGADARKSSVRQLLKDPSPNVRLRAAQGLLANKDGTGVETLIELLMEPSVEISWQAEELLHWAAHHEAGKLTIGSGEFEARKRCHDSWADWWGRRAQTLDWQRLEKDPSRPGLLLVCVGESAVTLREGRSYNLTKGHVRLYGSDDQIRWQLGTLGVRSLQLLRGNRILIAQQCLDLLTDDDVRLPLRVSEFDLHGHAVWHAKIPDSIDWAVLGCERGPDGITVVSLGKEGTAEYNHTGALDSRKPGDAGRIAAHTTTVPRDRLKGDLLEAILLPNGNVIELLYDRVAERNVEGHTVSQLFLPEPGCLLRNCFGLVRLGFDSPRSPMLDLATDVNYLITILKGNSPYARKASIGDIIHLGPRAAKATPALIELWANPEADISAYSEDAVRAIGAGALPYIRDAIKDPRPQVRGRAIAIFSQLCKPDNSTLEVILTATKDESGYVRSAAISSLPRSGSHLPSIIPALIRALKDAEQIAPYSQGSVAELAARQLGDLGPQAEEAVPSLMLAAKTDNLGLRIYCIGAIGKIRPKRKEVVRFLLKSLDADGVSNPETAEQIMCISIWSIGELGSFAKPAIPRLVNLFENPGNSVRVRVCALKSVANIGISDKALERAVLGAAKDQNSAVRDAAQRALDRIR